MLPACLLLATAKLIQLPYLEQFAFGRVDAKKMGVFICTLLFGETEDFREKGAQETCLNISRVSHERHRWTGSGSSFTSPNTGKGSPSKGCWGMSQPREWR